MSPACDHCYAEELMGRRLKTVTWGPGEPRKKTIPANWKEPLRWNAKAPTSEFAGIKGFWPVFCASLADVFDNEVPDEWRDELWTLLRATPNLTWQLLTKRVGNVNKMLPNDWGDGYANVWIGATVVNQYEADRDIPKLLAVPAVKRFLSIEPMLGPIDLAGMVYYGTEASGGIVPLRQKGYPQIDWVICGGESGDLARPVHPAWIESISAQCRCADVPFFFKQWGEWRPISQGPDDWFSGLYVPIKRAKAHEDQAVLDDIYGRRCTVPNAILHYDATVHATTERGAFAKDARPMHIFRVGASEAGHLLDGAVRQSFPIDQKGAS